MAENNDVILIDNIENKVKSKLKKIKGINNTGINNNWYAQFENKTEKISSYLFFSIYTEFQNHFEILKDCKNNLFYVMVHFEKLNINDNTNRDLIRKYCKNSKMIEYKGKDFSHRDEWGWFAFSNDENISKETTTDLNDLKSFNGTNQKLEDLADDLVNELERLYDAFF